MNDNELSEYYNKYIDYIEEEFSIRKIIPKLEVEEMKKSYTFRIFDKIHIKKLQNDLNTELNTFSEFLELIETRRN